MLAARDLRAEAALTMPSPKSRPQRPSARTKVKPALRPITKPLCAVLVLAVVMGAFLMAHRHSTLVRLGYEAERLSGRLAILQKENGELAVEVASLGSLSRVQSLAHGRLGMIRPTSSAMWVTPAPAVSTADGTTDASIAAQPRELRAEDGALLRLWRMLVRLTTNPAEASRGGP